ncbi:PIN domain-containing protein [Terriglobus sp. RCC_193]|uniref:PIN domain-containing protein n=1 Tax=Terriglobus sp. RCC_193 TaxID=3239218 RepID=UPI0035236643
MHASTFLPSSEKRRIDPGPGILVLDHLSRFVEVVDRSLYEEHEASARERMISRDEEDWPIVTSRQCAKV